MSAVKTEAKTAVVTESWFTTSASRENGGLVKVQSIRLRLDPKPNCA